LKTEVEEGRFRKDLFYRIHGVRVVIPPLRDRPEDIPLLVEHFSRSVPAQKKFSPAALEALAAYDWPGNVRELHFAVERASLLSERDLIDVGDLPPEILERPGRGSGSAAPKASARPAAEPRTVVAQGDDGDGDDGAGDLEEADEGRVRRALEEARWRREKAAEILGVSPRTLYRWIKKLGI
jgi:DNA-binding NtrC family response regulator